MSIQDSRETVTWMVKNLHGSRIKEFWEKNNSFNQQPDAEISDKDAGSEEIRALNQASISGQSEQGFQKLSRTTQEQFTNSNDEFVNCVSDTLTQNPREEETAHAPLRGASPQTVKSVEELEKDLPVAMDCTTLTLVDAAPSQSTSLRDAARTLLAENLSCGVEPKDYHVRVASRREDTGSAAPIAQNEKSLNSAMPAAGVAIANQTPKLVEQDHSAMLLVENSVSGAEVKADHEGEGSAAPVPNPEKWSHEKVSVFRYIFDC
ncbi:hypothetical protein ACWATR_00065 [Nostoc sp. UIC 10890]